MDGLGKIMDRRGDHSTDGKPLHRLAPVPLPLQARRGANFCAGAGLSSLRTRFRRTRSSLQAKGGAQDRLFSFRLFRFGDVAFGSAGYWVLYLRFYIQRSEFTIFQIRAAGASPPKAPLHRLRGGGTSASRARRAVASQRRRMGWCLQG